MSVASVGLPATRLLAFQRVECVPGASTRLTFHVPVGRLGFSGADLRYRVEPGAFTFTVGDLSETVAVTGDVAFPDRNALSPVSCETARHSAGRLWGLTTYHSGHNSLSVRHNDTQLMVV